VLVHHDLSGRCLVDGVVVHACGDEGGGEEMHELQSILSDNRPWVCGFCEFWQGEHPQGWYSENKWGGGLSAHHWHCHP
jgi:hypothetical protein